MRAFYFEAPVLQFKNSKYLELWEKNDILVSPRKLLATRMWSISFVPFETQERQILMK